MNAIVGLSFLLQESDLPEGAREQIDRVHESAIALMGILDDILDYSKVEAGQLHLEDTDVHLEDVLQRVADLFAGRMLQKRIGLSIDVAADVPASVRGDPLRLSQILNNLVGNAVKFTDHGYIMINVTGERVGEDAEMVISVVDTGIGIRKEDIPRMFEKFEQADGSNTRRFGGTGLGLAICKNLVDLMGGEIGAESEYGKGSRFWFKIKAAIDHKIRAMPSVTDTTFDGARVLAVDDNAVNRRVIAELAGGWGLNATVVDGAASALEALEDSVANGERFHVILMDYQMPDQSGGSLTRRIQSDSRFSEIPVVLLSSVDNTQFEKESAGARFVTALSKPVRPSQLMDVLARILVDDAALSISRVAQKMKEPEPALVELPTDHRPRILVAEDNVVNQLVVTNLISSKDYEVVIAENGRRAFELFQTLRPAAVLMDLYMPEMDGYEATRRIRELEAERRMQRTPIIAATAHVLEEDRDRCRLAGMNDFLPKPIRKQQLDELLGKWVEEAIAWDDATSA
jgi:CheY-like chemotaxis protein